MLKVHVALLMRHHQCNHLCAQVSMQLHDRHGQLEEACQLLQDIAGYSRVVVRKEPRFRGCCLVQVYAAR
jgi:hypothetical protein